MERSENLHNAVSLAELMPKDVVTKFVQMLYIEKKAYQAYEAWVKPDYIQHNPLVSASRAGAVAFLEGMFGSNPNCQFDIKRIIGDGDLVAVHFHARLEQNDLGMAIIDIFRVEDGVIAEHWDVIQPVPENDANGNGMF